MAHSALVAVGSDLLPGAESRVLPPAGQSPHTGVSARLAWLSASAGAFPAGLGAFCDSSGRPAKPKAFSGKWQSFPSLPGKGSESPVYCVYQLCGHCLSLLTRPHGLRTPIAHRGRRNIHRCPLLILGTVKPSSGQIFIGCQRNGKAVSFSLMRALSLPDILETAAILWLQNPQHTHRTARVRSL